MIDIKILRENPQRVSENCHCRGIELDVDDLHQKDQQYLSLLQEIESMRAERNRLSKEAGQDPDVRAQVKELKNSIAEKEKEYQNREAE